MACFSQILLLQLESNGCAQATNPKGRVRAGAKGSARASGKGSARAGGKGSARAGGKGSARGGGNNRAAGIPSTPAGSLEGNMSASAGVGLADEDTANRGQGMQRGRSNKAAAVSQRQELQVCSLASVAVLSLCTT